MLSVMRGVKKREAVDNSLSAVAAQQQTAGGGVTSGQTWTSIPLNCSVACQPYSEPVCASASLSD